MFRRVALRLRRPANEVRPAKGAVDATGAGGALSARLEPAAPPIAAFVLDAALLRAAAVAFFAGFDRPVAADRQRHADWRLKEGGLVEETEQGREK